MLNELWARHLERISKCLSVKAINNQVIMEDLTLSIKYIQNAIKI